MHSRLRSILSIFFLVLYFFNVSGFAVAATHASHAAAPQSLLKIKPGQKSLTQESDCQCKYLLHTAVCDFGSFAALPPKFSEQEPFREAHFILKKASREIHYRSSRAPPVSI